MDRQKFLSFLRKKLRGYPKADVEAAIAYYDELIRDKTANERMSEFAAVASLGDKNKIVSDCVSAMGSRRTGSVSGGIILGTLASPVLFPLAIVLFVAITVLVAVWGSLVVSFGAVAVGGVALTFGNWFFYEGMGPALLMTGSGLALFVVGAVICVALAVFGAKGIRSAFRKIFVVLKRRG